VTPVINIESRARTTPCFVESSVSRGAVYRMFRRMETRSRAERRGAQELEVETITDGQTGPRGPQSGTSVRDVYPIPNAHGRGSVVSDDRVRMKLMPSMLFYLDRLVLFENLNIPMQRQ